jgi:hypothetical protein
MCHLRALEISQKLTKPYNVIALYNDPNNEKKFREILRHSLINLIAKSGYRVSILKGKWNLTDKSIQF